MVFWPIRFVDGKQVKPKFYNGEIPIISALLALACALPILAPLSLQPLVSPSASKSGIIGGGSAEELARNPKVVTKGWSLMAPHIGAGMEDFCGSVEGHRWEGVTVVEVRDSIDEILLFWVIHVLISLHISPSTWLTTYILSVVPLLPLYFFSKENCEACSPTLY